MPPEIWVVFGHDQYGEDFLWPTMAEDPDFGINIATKETAERTARRLNRLGGNVSIRREVWSGPKAAYVTPRDENQQ